MNPTPVTPTAYDPAVVFVKALVPEPRLALAWALVHQENVSVPLDPRHAAYPRFAGLCRTVLDGAGLDPAALPAPGALTKLARGTVAVHFDRAVHQELVENALWTVETATGRSLPLYLVVMPVGPETRALVEALEKTLERDEREELRADAFVAFVQRTKQRLTRGLFQYTGQGALYRYVQRSFFGASAVDKNGRTTRMGPHLYLDRLFERVGSASEEIDATDLHALPAQDVVELQDEFGADVKGMAGLTERERSVLLQHFVHGRTYAEIAEANGESVNAVTSCATRALDKLRKAVEQPR